MFWAPCHTGHSVLYDDEQMRNPDCIYAAVIDHQATYINLVPTMLRAICESALKHKPKKNSLRLISCGGDVYGKWMWNLRARHSGNQ